MRCEYKGFPWGHQSITIIIKEGRQHYWIVSLINMYNYHKKYNKHAIASSNASWYAIWYCTYNSTSNTFQVIGKLLWHIFQVYTLIRPRKGVGGIVHSSQNKIKPESQFTKKITHISHFTTKIIFMLYLKYFISDIHQYWVEQDAQVKRHPSPDNA